MSTISFLGACRPSNHARTGGVGVGATAFQLYVLTHPEMRRRLSEENAKVYRRAARMLTDVMGAEQLPMPAEQFVRVLDALTTGLLFTYFQTPDLISTEDFVAAFEALA